MIQGVCERIVKAACEGAAGCAAGAAGAWLVLGLQKRALLERCTPSWRNVGSFQQACAKHVPACT